MGTDNKDSKIGYCEWCAKKTPLPPTTQAETPILEFIEDKIDLIGREDIWGVHGDWSLMEIDSDLEAELLIYDEMLNNVQKRIVCTACIMNEEKMYNKYYGDMIGEDDEDNPDDEDHYIIELE
tara:strand:+ start:204 stop:572 length:369 start_codon:yes stop_codon:yes gene_type:complete